MTIPLKQPAIPPPIPCYVHWLRQEIVKRYSDVDTGGGNTFGEILGHELRCAGPYGNGLDWHDLAAKWGISLTALGELIYDWCKHLEEGPNVNHDYEPQFCIPNLPVSKPRRFTSSPSP